MIVYFVHSDEPDKSEIYFVDKLQQLADESYITLKTSFDEDGSSDPDLVELLITEIEMIEEDDSNHLLIIHYYDVEIREVIIKSMPNRATLFFSTGFPREIEDGQKVLLWNKIVSTGLLDKIVNCLSYNESSPSQLNEVIKNSENIKQKKLDELLLSLDILIQGILTISGWCEPYKIDRALLSETKKERQQPISSQTKLNLWWWCNDAEEDNGDIFTTNSDKIGSINQQFSKYPWIWFEEVFDCLEATFFENQNQTKSLAELINLLTELKHLSKKENILLNEDFLKLLEDEEHNSLITKLKNIRFLLSCHKEIIKYFSKEKEGI